MTLISTNFFKVIMNGNSDIMHENKVNKYIDLISAIPDQYISSYRNVLCHSLIKSETMIIIEAMAKLINNDKVNNYHLKKQKVYSKHSLLIKSLSISRCGSYKAGSSNTSVLSSHRSSSVCSA